MAKRKKQTKTPTLSEQLRAAIVDSGLSLQQLARESGVDVSILSRFARRERTMTLELADRLAIRLGLALWPAQ